MKRFIGEDISINLYHEKPLTEQFCYCLLRDLPEKVGLTRYADPSIHSFPNKQIVTENGITGTTIMIESHIGIHDWPAGRIKPDVPFTHITISSCKKVNINSVILFLSEVFGTGRIVWDRMPWRDPNG